MRQPSLFDDPQSSRNRDPKTSHVAAEEIRPKINKMQERVLSVFGPKQERTAQEAAQECINRYCTDRTVLANCESYRKRMHELVRSGHLKIVGERYCLVTHRMASAYERIDT